MSESTSTTSKDDNELSLVVLGIYGRGKERYRLQTDPTHPEYEQPLFRPQSGLVYETKEGALEPHQFFHIYTDKKLGDRGDRAILFQSMENYETISKHKLFSDFFPLADFTSEISENQPLTSANYTFLQKRVLERPSFGEQVIVKGAGPSDVSLGDIFEVADRSSPLRVQVTSPRKPCYWVDKTNGTPYGPKGLKQFTQGRGLAGWFTKVLIEGELRNGMKMVRTQHPYPKWTLENISQAVFGGEGDPKMAGRGQASWGRSEEELQELLNIDVLSKFEWKENLENFIQKRQQETRNTGLFAQLFGSNNSPGGCSFQNSIGDKLVELSETLCMGQCIGIFECDDLPGSLAPPATKAC